MLKNQTQTELDQHQFAYRHNRSVDDAVMSFIHYTHEHLDKKDSSYVRILYVDFSSAFNTVQTHLLAQKLNNMHVNSNLNLWVCDFLTDRTQAVKYISHNSPTPSISAPVHSPSSSSSDSPSSSPSTSVCLSSVKHINTGTPQGTVISPFVFTLYTNDCRSTRKDTAIIKFSDDTAIVDKSEDVSAFEEEVRKFSSWCQTNHLELNVGKTKEMVVDFKRQKSDIPPLDIHGQTVERVTEYKYLGTVIDNKLTFSSNVEGVYKKCRQRMHLMYQLRAYMVSSKILEKCYRAYVESVLTFSFVCWFGSVTVKDRNRLNGVVNECSNIVGSRQISLADLYSSRVKSRALKIKSDPSHVLADCYEILPSGRRLRATECRTTRFQKTFIPASITFLNHE